MLQKLVIHSYYLCSYSLKVTVQKKTVTEKISSGQRTQVCEEEPSHYHSKTEDSITRCRAALCFGLSTLTRAKASN